MTRLQGWTRWLLLVVSLVVAIGAIPVGVGFVIAPDGSRVGMPLDLLQGTPFASFRIPGLLLAVAVGGSTLTAAILLARRHRHALAASFLAGAIVVGWISVQVVLIGLASPLQPIVAALGLALILLAWPPASPTE